MSKTIYTGTTYDEIYQVFIRKLTDFSLLSMDDTDLYDIMSGYLSSAIANFPECEELQYRDNATERFRCTLSPIVIEALALLMLEEWISPKVYNILNMKQFLGDSEYKYYSQANQLEKLQNLKDFANNEAERRIIQYGNIEVDISTLR